MRGELLARRDQLLGGWLSGASGDDPVEDALFWYRWPFEEREDDEAAGKFDYVSDLYHQGRQDRPPSASDGSWDCNTAATVNVRTAREEDASAHRSLFDDIDW